MIGRGDGPPFCTAQSLARCRRILKELGEAEPEMPPFDPSSFAPLPYEADVLRLIRQLRRRRRKGAATASIPRGFRLLFSDDSAGSGG